MVRRFLTLIEKQIRGLHEAALLLAIFMLLSQVLALLRDRTFAHLFGAGAVLDAYFAAFRIPDLVFSLVTLSVSSFALIPLLSGRSKEEQGSVLGTVMFIFGIGAALLSSVVFVIAPTIVPLLIPGFDATTTAHTVLLTRIMMLQPFLLGLSSIASALVQVERRFVTFALAPIAYNIGIIFGAVFLFPTMGVTGLGWGVVLGALLHALVQVSPIIFGVGRVPLRVKWGEIRATLVRVVGPSIPRSVAMMGNQGLLIASSAIASLVSVGAVSSMSLAFNLQSVPLTVIGVAYASALFPALSAFVAAGDRDSFARELWASVRHAAFWLLPAITLFIVLRAHVVRVVLGSGAFSWDDTRLTAAILALFAISLVAQALILIFSRAYYALGRTLVPIVLNVGGSVAAAALAYMLVVTVHSHPFIQFWVESLLRVSDIPGTAVLMVPAAYSLSMVIIASLFGLLLYRSHGGASVLASMGVSAAASILGGAGAYGALQFLGPALPTNTFIGIFAAGLTAGLCGLLVWVVVLWLLRSREANDLFGIARTYYERTHS